MVPRKAVFWGVREEQLRQKEKPITSTHFNLTTGKGSYKRGYFTADWKRETTFLGMWDKTVFLQERDLYLCKASKNRRER